MVTFVDLRISDDVVDNLDRLHITRPKELALLSALLIEMPIGDDIGDIDRQHLNRVLDSLCTNLCHSHIVCPKPDVCVSSQHNDGIASYRLKIVGHCFLLESTLTLPEEQVGPTLLRQRELDDSTFTLECSYERDPFSPVKSAVDVLDERSKSVVIARFGLGGTSVASLEKIGIALGVTRERARQIEESALKKLSRPHYHTYYAWASTVALSYADQLKVRPADELVARAIEQNIPTVTRPVLPWLKLLAAIMGESWSRKDADDGSSGTDVVVAVTKAIVAALSRYGAMAPDELQARVADICSLPNDATLMTRMQLSNSYVLQADGICTLSNEPIQGIRDKQLRRLNSIIGLLEQDGPRHFTQILHDVNARLIPQYAMSERDVHAWLGRFPEYFVWAGPGTYALKNSGVGIRAENVEDVPDLPPQYQKRRRKGIGDEIVALLMERGPLTLADIEAHVLPRFYVNRTSVEAAILQDAGGRFIVRSDGNIALRDGDDALPARRPKWVRIMDNVIASLMPRARELRDDIRKDAQTGYARLNGTALFNHMAVAAVLGLEAEWPGLETAPGGADIPSEAWAAVQAVRIGQERIR